MIPRLQFYRKRVQLFLRLEKWMDLFAILITLGFFISYLPPEVLNDNPATGGDTGSHFWPLYTLVKQGLPNWHVRVWNPGNLGGEPHLTHYFPFPYFFMALLSLVMPLGKAFNIGTIFPVMIFPMCVYFCFRGLKTRFPIPLLAMMASLSFLYNESFSMWGGNTVSTLAGQFAHVYAFNFFLLAIGCMHWELSKDRKPMISGLLFAGVLISHFYVALMMPVVFLVFLFCHPNGSLRQKFYRLTISGAIALGASAWFVLPMLHNSPWNTAFGLKWGGAQLMKEIFPQIFWPFAIIVLLFAAFFFFSSFRRPLIEREWRVPLTLCLFMSIVGVVYYFIFPPMGLVDVRVIPQIQMLLVLIAAIYIGLFLRRYVPRPWVLWLMIPLMALSVFSAGRQVRNFPGWMKWNYSGWESKTAYKDLQALSDTIRGDFSDPRVIYENNDLSNAAGTIRVFEMLPYFSGRSVYESVYMQATILAPAAFFMQALISKTPSCPFPNYKCTNYKMALVENYLDLMGINQLIVITPEVKAQADAAAFLTKKGDFGVWHVYESIKQTSLVNVLHRLPTSIPIKEYKTVFYEWFRTFVPDKGFLIVDRDGISEDKSIPASALAKPDECHPEVIVNFDQIKLKTDCPGKFHYLKFAFHPTWQASGGEKLYLLSPGFIGLIPKTGEVTLTWGRHWFWTFANTISWLTLALTLAALFFEGYRRRRQC